MSEQKTAKVEDVIQIREWENPTTKQVIYYHVIALDNGDKGSVGKKSRDAVKVGDTLTYTIDGDKIKQVQQNGSGGGFSDGRGTPSSPASFALSYAKDIAVANIAKSDKPLEMSSLAPKIIDMATVFNKWLQENK